MAPKIRSIVVAQLGAHRGAHAVVRATAQDSTKRIGQWTFIDPKDGRAAELAALVKSRFPEVVTDAQVAEGVAALPSADADVVIATMDSIAATAAVASRHNPRQNTILQIVGRVAGATSVARIGFAALVRTEAAQQSAELLLHGFEALTTSVGAPSSRRLTQAGDPLSARILKPLRDEAARQSVRYLNDVVRMPDDTREAPLTLLTAGERFPLTVLDDEGESFSARQRRALSAVDRIGRGWRGELAAVAVVSVTARAIDLLFIRHTRSDRRWVYGVETLRRDRTASLLRPAVTIFTD